MRKVVLSADKYIFAYVRLGEGYVLLHVEIQTSCINQYDRGFYQNNCTKIACHESLPGIATMAPESSQRKTNLNHEIGFFSSPAQPYICTGAL